MKSLTKEQKKFAEKNHKLVFDFIYKKKLNPDDWYDILVFGYLNAVCNYNPSKSKFSTYAYLHMEYARKREHYDKNRDKRAIELHSVSLNQIINKEIDSYGDSELIENLSDGYCLQDESDSKNAVESFLCGLSDRDRKILVLKSNGYNNNQIGDMFALSRETIRQRIGICKRKYRKYKGSL